ncbi:MAG TPA: GNAT family N-acetyltransferase [Dehalococcoidia bacterium]|nr:GNAT family N-acetyltransferase [Dehalococcoidia bacterium]
MNVRRAEGEDRDVLQAWLADALSGATGSRTTATSAAERLLSMIRDRPEDLRIIEVDGRPEGLVKARDTRATCTFDAVAVRPSARGGGIAAKAILEIEDSSRASRFVGALAPADGRALYFWLRLGYRPVRRPDGRVEMERRRGQQ